MKNIDWAAYQIFLSVVQYGGLSGAAKSEGLSPATIGRRVLDLEERIGTPLFVRSQTGYTLTPEGQGLFSELLDMQAAARKVENWRVEKYAPPLVRVATGTWLSRLFCQNIHLLCGPDDPFRLDFFIAERRARLAHREADIGLRAFEPEEQNLAARRLPDIFYGVYRARTAAASLDRFIAVSDEEAVSTYLRWPHENRADKIAFTVTRPTAMLDIALAGAGLCVLPCLVGESEPGLQRVGGLVDELQHGNWIIMNREDRHRREIRVVIDRMTKLIKSYADVFAGKRPAELQK
jgi:DNA-binding transcriptional LysR family regulator